MSIIYEASLCPSLDVVVVKSTQQNVYIGKKGVQTFETLILA